GSGGGPVEEGDAEGVSGGEGRAGGDGAPPVSGDPVGGAADQRGAGVRIDADGRPGRRVGAARRDGRGVPGSPAEGGGLRGTARSSWSCPHDGPLTAGAGLVSAGTWPGASATHATMAAGTVVASALLAPLAPSAYKSG